MINNPTKSMQDKIKELLRINYKLLLCHVDSLTCLRSQKKMHPLPYDEYFVNKIYEHYIEKKLTKQQYFNI